MAVNSLEVLGYRGFATSQSLEFSVPNNQAEGSGITFILGANNSGKSAFLEVLKFFGGGGVTPELDGSQRNRKAGQRIEARINFLNNETGTLKTVATGGSVTETRWSGNNAPNIYYLPARRLLNHKTHRSGATRRDAMQQLSQKTRDNSTLDYFHGRLFQLVQNEEELKKYNALLAEILGYELKWTIEKEGNHFIQYEIDAVTHTSEGAGDGIINLMIIADALYEAAPIDTIIIDEPEVSLHPSAQRRLYSVIKRYSQNVQIILATHSPYFIDFEAIAQGANAARFYKEGDEIQIKALPATARTKIQGILNNARNPHILGANAKEIFFVSDGILLVEGQDDVLCLERASRELGIPVQGNMFGWGVGGETNMPFFAELLKSLGYKKVVGILDSNATVIADLRRDHPEYTFLQLSCPDIRDKNAENAKVEKIGLFTSGCQLKRESQDELRQLLQATNNAFNGVTPPT